jgi:PKD repeat protein
MPKALIARLSFVAACVLAWAGCTVKEIEAPPLSGPSDFALSFQVTATPDSLSQDGGSQSTVVVRAFDASGSPKPGARFRLDVFAGGVPVDYGTLSFKDVTTGADGRAVSIYTAPSALPAGANLPTCDGMPGGCVAITATPVGSDFGTSRQQQVILHLIPLGVILPPSATPTAVFTFSSASANLPVQFDASTSCAGQTTASGACPSSAGTITAYEWDFGDGGTGSGRLASHSFTRPTGYNVTLTVTNDRGVKASTTKLVTVGAGSPPTASFVFGPTPVLLGAETYFDASGSTAGIGHTIVSYQWNWGDGELSPALSTPYQEHDYQRVGSFSVVLTVTDETGQLATATRTVAVQ